MTTNTENISTIAIATTTRTARLLHLIRMLGETRAALDICVDRQDEIGARQREAATRALLDHGEIDSTPVLTDELQGQFDLEQDLLDRRAKIICALEDASK